MLLYVDYGLWSRFAFFTWEIFFDLSPQIGVQCRNPGEYHGRMALDIGGLEESMSSIVDSSVHVKLADVVKSIDTVDRDVLDLVVDRLGLPGWFRRVYFFSTMLKSSPLV